MERDGWRRPWHRGAAAVSTFVDVTARGLDRVLAVLRVLATAGVWFGGGLLVLLSFAVGTEVLMRRLANHSFTGVDELGGYTLAIVSAIAFTSTLLNRGHIRIDLVHQRFGPRGRAILDLLAMAGLIAFYGLLLKYAWLLLDRSYTMGSRSVSPLSVVMWIPQSLWFAGLLLFVVTAVTLFLRSLLALCTGDLRTVNALIGTLSADDEVAEELALNAEAQGKEVVK
ncbi:TRAP transporter small permease [Sinirhodobacter populi]|nr:TRAP transporter small permease [Sinirhodobacter populi]